MTRRVESERPDARVALESLLQVVIRHGATVHPAFQIVERDGEISVRAEASIGDMLIDLPEALLVPLTETRWDAVGDRLAIQRHGLNATPAQREIAEAMVDVYNATGKLAWTRTRHPLAVFQDDAEVVDVLRALRPRPFDPSPSLIDVFLNSRRYERNGAHWLLPVIDLMNNHDSGAALDVSEGSMTVEVSRPADSDVECFVHYGPRRDAIDIALTWGYLDCNVPFARSIPLVADVDLVGTIEITGHRVTPRSVIDPPRIAVTEGRLMLSHHTFNADQPQFAAATLRLAVEGLLRHTHSKIDPEQATRHVERAIVRANLERLTAAAHVVANRNGPAADVLRDAVECQRVTTLRGASAGF